MHRWNPRLVTLRSSLHREARSVINRGFRRWKLWYYRTLIYCETTFVTIPKSYETLIYFGKKYCTILKTMAHWFTMEKTMVLYRKPWTFDLQSIYIQLYYTKNPPNYETSIYCRKKKYGIMPPKNRNLV